MKKLFILRHAHATNDYADDFNRNLNDEGIAKCSNVAQILSPYINNIDLILCSASLRTSQTIQNILADLSIIEVNIDYSDEFYHISVNQLFQHLRNLDNKYQNILLVNHNPTISHLGIFLTPEYSPLYIEVLQGFDPGSLALYECQIDFWTHINPKLVQLQQFWR